MKTKNLDEYVVLAQQALQTQSTTQILQSFCEHNVLVIVLKGQALLNRVYSEPAKRTMQDVDLLVRYQDLNSVEAILQSAGYTFSEEGWGFAYAYTREHTGEIPYRKGTIVVELHWHLFPLAWYRRLLHVNMDALWTRAMPIQIGESVAMRLCPEDEIIHLCCHTAIQHSLIHPHGYRDILGVISVERDNLDWPTLTARAREWRVSVAVWAALSVARAKEEGRRQKEEKGRGREEVTRMLIPAEVLDALRVPRWRQRLLRPFVQQATEGRTVLISGTMRFLGVLLIDRVRDLPGVVLRGLFPGKRWLQLRYNLSPRQAFWRQFVYPLQVLARGAGALFNALRPHS